MNLLANAMTLHQSGQMGSAAQLYQQVLTREQGNADALHLLGVLRHQQGDHTRAVELIGRAVALRPNVPGFHSNLAEVYRAMGQHERAAGCCRTALRLSPDFPDAHCNLGLALQEMGRHGEAAEHFRRALQLRPDLVVAHGNLGIALRQLGQLQEALTHFRRAVELDPTSPLARSNLGQCLLDSGQAEEALVYSREAVRLQPNLAPLHHNLGNVCRALGRPVEARAAYLEAIRLDANLAPPHAHLGLLLFQDGQLGDALPWLKQAVELMPNNADFWENLAELHGEREEHVEAIPCWQRALTLEPERASAHNGLGWALQEEGGLTEAAAHFRAALQLNPNAPAAHLNLGGLHEELGELEQAEASFRAAQRLQPNFALPYARLATLLRGKLPDEDLVALEERLADPQLADEPRCHMFFALAHVRDARREFDRAADALRQGNAVALELARQRERNYLPAEHERFVTGLLQTFNSDFYRRLSPPLAALCSPGQPDAQAREQKSLACASGCPGGAKPQAATLGRRPVFVFGLPRSGTTLIEQVLASHSRVHGAGELRLARQSFEAIPGTLGRSEAPLDCVPHLDAAALHRLAERHGERLAALDAGAERVVDKMPDNYLYLGLMAAMFPRATFIHCRRDLRDVAVSCWMTDFRSIRWANDPGHIASRFQQYRRVMDHWRAVLPVTIHEVDYADTVTDLEGVARRLVAACGLDWEPACLEFHRTQRPIRTASVIQVRQPVYTNSVARWKNYERDLGDLFAALPRQEERIS